MAVAQALSFLDGTTDLYMHRRRNHFILQSSCEGARVFGHKMMLLKLLVAILASRFQNPFEP